MDKPDRQVLQRIMQILGPDLPDVDYTDPSNVAGLCADVEMVLRILHEAGIEFHN